MLDEQYAVTYSLARRTGFTTKKLWPIQKKKSRASSKEGAGATEEN